MGTKNPFALRSNAFPCYGTVVAYTPSSNKEPTSSTAATNAPQASSTAAYLDSLSTISQSTPPTLNNENNNSQDEAAQSQSPSSVPMDTPARQSLPDHLRLHPFPNKGLGVITTIPISKGTFIGEYQGEIFTQEVHDRRYLPSQSQFKTKEDEAWIQSRLQRNQSLTGCYVYGITIPPTSTNNFQDDQRIFIDAEDEHCSSWARFINHASPPNNNLIPKSVHESYDGKPRVWFVACRDIEVGEELCYDYGDNYWLEEDEVV